MRTFLRENRKEEETKSRILIRRAISAIIGASLILFLLILGRISFGLLVILLSFLALIEFYLPWSDKNIFPNLVIGIAGGISFPLLALAKLPELNGLVVILLIIALFWWQILSTRRIRPGVAVGVTLLGALYVGLFSSYLILIRDLDRGWVIVLLLLLAIWSCDITAYLVGILFGKRKLAVKISPNKTIEGAVAGVIASIIILGSIYWLPWLPLLKRIILGFLIGVFGQIGDLGASMFKRELDIKDYGWIIPGHGGILDRFDSLFFAAPIVFYYFRFL